MFTCTHIVNGSSGLPGLSCIGFCTALMMDWKSGSLRIENIGFSPGITARHAYMYVDDVMRAKQP